MVGEIIITLEKSIMGLIFVFAIPLIVIILLALNKIYIDWGSILSKTIPLDTGLFGVYCFTGKQGSGKTYSLTKYVKKHHRGEKIYSNMTIKGIKYTPIKSVDHLLSLRDEKNLFIIYDEILSLLEDKQIPKPMRKKLMIFLSQQRKMGNILMTTAQEWLEIPVTFRRFVRIQVECKTRPLGRWGGILVEEYFDAYQMKWDQMENEYVAPRIRKKYSKYEKRFMLAYDTYERIEMQEQRIASQTRSAALANTLTEAITAM